MSITTSSGAITVTSAAALNLNPASGSAIVLDGTINVDAGVITNATSITSATQVASTSLKTPLIEYTDGDDAMTIADGGAVTFGQEAQFSSGLQSGGSVETATIDYTDGDVAMTIADGGAVTFGQEAQFSSGLQTAGSVETATIDYTDGDLAITIANGGGVTTSGDLAVTDDLSLASDAAVLSLGADGDVSLTHVPDTGVRLNATSQIQFRDNALLISSTSDGQLDIDADTEVEITATTVDLNGALDVSGNITTATSLQTATIDYTDGDVAMMMADGGAVTFGQEA